MSISFRPEASRSVVVLDGVDRVAFNEDGSMELLTPAANPTGNKVMTAGQMPFTKGYESAPQVITGGTTVTLAHGLGRAPILLFAELICVAADAGYSIGDVIVCPTNVDYQSSGTYNGVFYKDITNVYFRMTSTAFYVGNKSGGASVLTLAKWNMVLRAWA